MDWRRLCRDSRPSLRTVPPLSKVDVHEDTKIAVQDYASPGTRPIPLMIHWMIAALIRQLKSPSRLTAPEAASAGESRSETWKFQAFQGSHTSPATRTDPPAIALIASPDFCASEISSVKCSHLCHLITFRHLCSCTHLVFSKSIRLLFLRDPSPTSRSSVQVLSAQAATPTQSGPTTPKIFPQAQQHLQRFFIPSTFSDHSTWIRLRGSSTTVANANTRPGQFPGLSSTLQVFVRRTPSPILLIA